MKVHVRDQTVKFYVFIQPFGYECISAFECRRDGTMFCKFVKQLKSRNADLAVLRSRALYNNCAKINAEKDFVK